MLFQCTLQCSLVSHPFFLFHILLCAFDTFSCAPFYTFPHVPFYTLSWLDRICTILKSESEPAILVQAAAVLGSFACNSEPSIVQILVSSGTVPCLLHLLSHDSPPVIATALRSLKILFECAQVPRDLLFRPNQELLLRVIALLSVPRDDELNQISAAFVANVAVTEHEQGTLFALGAVQPLCKLLFSKHAKSQQSALEALSVLTRHEQVAKVMAQDTQVTERILCLVKDKRASLRLFAMKWYVVWVVYVI